MDGMASRLVSKLHGSRARSQLVLVEECILLLLKWLLSFGLVEPVNPYGVVLVGKLSVGVVLVEVTKAMREDVKD